MTTSILAKMSKLNKVDQSKRRTPMTDIQFEQCKEAIMRDNRGYNVQPNRFDIEQPYRVAINFNDEWNNFGNFSSADVAAAVGSIVSSAYFGERAITGEFNQELAENHPEFKEWIEDERNQAVLLQANGEKPCVMESGNNKPNPF